MRHFVQLGDEALRFENDMRATFFGPSASTQRVTQELEAGVDIRDSAAVERVFGRHKGSLGVAVHTAASLHTTGLPNRREDRLLGQYAWH